MAEVTHALAGLSQEEQTRKTSWSQRHPPDIHSTLPQSALNFLSKQPDVFRDKFRCLDGRSSLPHSALPPSQRNACCRGLRAIFQCSHTAQDKMDLPSSAAALTVQPQLPLNARRRNGPAFAGICIRGLSSEKLSARMPRMKILVKNNV